MPVLTYAYLGDSIQVGQPLGCDVSGWPYRVVAVRHAGPFFPGDGGLPPSVSPLYAPDVHTLVTLEEWPIPGREATPEEREAYHDAMAHARERSAGWVE